jgi:transposase
MQVRYRYRLYPAPGQRQALARTFGCARVVYNDCLRVRNEAYANREKISDTEVQRRVITLAKLTPERTWLADVASVALVQACQDARRAYKNWFDSLTGRCIEEKAARYGRTFARIGRFEPTSQVCSTCGVKDGPKPLAIRTWQCMECGTVHDRDINAARNILAAGRADKPNACGTGVRPSLTVAAGAEAGTHRSAA